MGFGVKMLENALMKAAARIWPTRFHEDMLIEEISELQERLAHLSISILHHRRNRIDMDYVAEEIVDVQLCIEQFIECHELHEVVEQIRAGKICRLSDQIKEQTTTHGDDDGNNS